MSVNQQIFRSKNKSFAVLVDPDKTNPGQFAPLLSTINEIAEISAIFVGGSLVPDGTTEVLIQSIRGNTTKPVILFPGNVNQICAADAILFLSLISGRNPEYLIGQHITGAPLIKKLGMEAISTGYILVGDPSSTTYVSNTSPIPSNEIDLATTTAIAGEMLGHSLIYMDAGSGTQHPISSEMIEKVYKSINIPLIIGGGIRSYEDAKKALIAGAHCIVIGNAAEKDTSILFEIASAVHDSNKLLEVH